MIAELMKNARFLSTDRWKGRASSLVFASVSLIAALASPSRALAMCPLSQTNPSVTVCTPTPYSIVNIIPAHVVAGTTDSNPVTTIQIYVDNKLVYQLYANSLDTYIPLAVGNHLLTVQAWDTTGATFKTNVPISETPPCALNSANQSVTICTRESCHGEPAGSSGGRL